MSRAYFNNAYECIRLLYRPKDHKDAFLFGEHAFLKMMDYGAAVGVEHRDIDKTATAPVKRDMKVVVSRGYQGVFHYWSGTDAATVILGTIGYRGILRPTIEVAARRPCGMNVVYSLLHLMDSTLDDFIVRRMH
jgi:hypothetical protein